MNATIQPDAMAAAIRQALYRRSECGSTWVDAITDAAEFAGVCPFSLGDALHDAGWIVPSIIRNAPARVTVAINAAQTAWLVTGRKLDDGLNRFEILTFSPSKGRAVEWAKSHGYQPFDKSGRAL